MYSILSPEGFASILWKDASQAREAAELMKLGIRSYNRGIVDRLFGEPAGGKDESSRSIYERMKNALITELGNDLERTRACGAALKVPTDRLHFGLGVHFKSFVQNPHDKE